MTVRSGTWKRVKRKQISGMSSRWRITGRRYIEVVRKWQEPRALSELSSCGPVVPLLRKGTAGAAGKN